MWLRDSVEQVIHYVPLAKNDVDLQRIIGGLIKRHMFYINIDPYANAFNEGPNDWHWDANDQTDMPPWVWERKYELDSMCFTIVSLRQMQEIAKYGFRDEAFVKEMHKLEKEMEHGIQLYGTCNHPTYGKMYVYETDGYVWHMALSMQGLTAISDEEIVSLIGTLGSDRCQYRLYA